MNILTIFPTPIYTTYLNCLDKKLLKEIDKYKKDPLVNPGNISSKDIRILDKHPFKNLKNNFMKHIYQYVRDIINPRDELNFYITSSWLNWTDKNQYHHLHAHPNSLISGVYYINADSNKDKLIFERNTYTPFEITPKEYNLFNSQIWWIPVEKNKLVLFPSSLFHKVATVKEDYTRISLAFNVFVKGEIGRKDGLTYLNIK